MSSQACLDSSAICARPLDNGQRSTVDLDGVAMRSYPMEQVTVPAMPLSETRNCAVQISLNFEVAARASVDASSMEFEARHWSGTGVGSRSPLFAILHWAKDPLVLSHAPPPTVIDQSPSPTSAPGCGLGFAVGTEQSFCQPSISVSVCVSLDFQLLNLQNLKLIYPQLQTSDGIEISALGCAAATRLKTRTIRNAQCT